MPTSFPLFVEGSFATRNSEATVALLKPVAPDLRGRVRDEGSLGDSVTRKTSTLSMTAMSTSTRGLNVPLDLTG
ncbi:hypothetical protein NL676_015362 [Syzygium grande]|nr:hypothetical protein NL676_015362 [Syzygium grande]